MSVPVVHEPFAHAWAATVLATAPMIAPARQFVYPQQVAGEEDALGRGAMLVSVKPARGAEFLATCALGFRERSLPSGVWSCPNSGDLLAIAGGYAYLVDTARPEVCVHLPMRPVTRVAVAAEQGLLLLAGFHNVLAVGEGGIAWESERLSWEGVVLGEMIGGALHGTGWDMHKDEDVAFVMDLRTGRFTGGGFRR
jgi:hypothetical protein